MVRVISVHHFAHQHIQTIEQPTACTTAPPDKLLLALTNNCIEVRDLGSESGEVMFSFPSVDEVLQMVHCMNGDYVATLETKFNRQNKDTNFVRIYLNWHSVATLQQSKMTSGGLSLGSTSECGMVQPMRARIAGRVTPTSNQSEVGSLEMIEIPIAGGDNPHWVQCCQVSGNLGVVCGSRVTFYCFRVKTHDLSRMKFVDFDHSGVCIELAFVPSSLFMAEEYVVAMVNDRVHLFQVDGRGGSEGHGVVKDFDSCDEIDYERMVQERWTMKQMTVNLPSIVRDNSVIHKNSPFTFYDKDMTARICQNGETKTQHHTTTDLIQLKLVPILVEKAQRQITEEFKAVILKPLYVDEQLTKNHHDNRNNSNNNKQATPTNFLHSVHRRSLRGVVCLVATQQEGYLHFFPVVANGNPDNCITVYPFTAPVHDLVMENSFLHALTDTGLESYTLRFGHLLCQTLETMDDRHVTCPPATDPVCLVGLRPFLGVERLLLSDRRLVLLANADSSPTHSTHSSSSSAASYWTLYNLELPNPRTVFNDVSIVANCHRFTSAQTYRHLLGEAHVILRVALILTKWALDDCGGGGNVTSLIKVARRDNVDDVVETYRTSCALLGDHYIMAPSESDYKMAVPYYKMAAVTHGEVIKRVKKIHDQSQQQQIQGLVYYLTKTLLELDHYHVSAKKSQRANEHQSLYDAILDHVSPDDLPDLIVKSRSLRQNCTDRLVKLLQDTAAGDHRGKVMALVILYVEKCDDRKAARLLDERLTDGDYLEKQLTDNWQVLFEPQQSSSSGGKKNGASFSDLARLLLASHNHSDLLSQILVGLVCDKKVLTLHKLIKAFLDYLPSSCGNFCGTIPGVVTLQKTLEQFFERFKSHHERLQYERGVAEALKLLTRSYLSQLQLKQLTSTMTTSTTDPSEPCDDYFVFTDKKRGDSFLFSDFRHAYLDRMPPIQVEVTGKLYQACLNNINNNVNNNNGSDEDNKSTVDILRKLQAVLCTPLVTKQVMSEVSTFVSLNESLIGGTSLRSIVTTVEEGVLLLAEACPQCLLQFGKDRFTRPDQWKLLIGTVQRKILRLGQDEVLNPVCFFHKKVLKDVMTHVATSMSLEELVQVFPQRGATGDDNRSHFVFGEESGGSDLDLLNEIQNYEPYVVMCRETMHANQINKLIVTTGQQLLCTLSL